MRTKDDRRKSETKQLKQRINICKSSHCYSDDDIDYIIRKTDIPHSFNSNYFNPYETKSMKNKKDRLKSKLEINKMIEE